MKSLLSKVGVLILILTLVFPINAFPAKIVQAAAEVTTIGYEGYLTDSSDEALDSSEDFTVRIYNDPSLSAISNLLYEETHANVAINNGYFSIQMGSGSTTVVNADADGTANEAGEDSLSDLPFDAPYYVSLNITSLSTGEMTPRTSINAVAYANTSYGLIAQNSDPVNASKGQMYFKTTDNTVYVYDGAGWNALAMGGGGTFYTANGSITGARVVTMNAASTVTFDGSGDFVIDDTGALSATALTSTGLVTSVGLTTTGNITHTGAGTLSTGTGNVSLNGNTTVTGANTFTANGNSQFNGTVDINGTFNLDSATLSGSAISTDGTLGSNSNNLLSTQRAVKTYVDNSVNGLSWRPAADLFDDSTTDVAASMVGQAAYVIDTIAVADGDRVLFTAETTSPGTYDNRVFVVSGVGAAIVLTLETDGQAANGDPTEGDSLFVKDGTANGSKNYTYNGTDWVLAASVSGALVTSNNLSDVLDAAEAAANIGLGTTSVPTLMGVTLTGVTSTILKTDVTGAVSAAIAGTDYLGTALASGSILLGNAGGVATATGISGDATLSNAGVLTIAGNAVGTAEIADGTIALADLASDSVSAAKIVDGSIINADLANDAVNSAKILDASIALADMAADSVSSAKIVDGTIATADVANNAIDGTKIGLTGEATADMMYYNGTDWVVLAATGNANKVLQMNAGETAPTWVTGVTTNLYTANGTLTANRTVTTGGFSLTIDGTGDIVFSDSGNITTAGDLAVNGGDITSTGAITIDGTGTLTLADNVAQSGAGTFTTGTGLFTTGGAAAITGNTTMTGDLALNGGDLTTTGDLTITPAGGDINFSDNSTINIGGNPTDVLFNVIGDSSGGATSLNSDDDLYIEGNLEVDGSTQFDGTVAFNSAATFSAGLSCTDCLDFSSLADALSLDANTTLATGANTLTLTGIADMTGTVLSGSSPLVFEGTSLDANETTFAFADPTSDQTITFPDSTGTVALWGSMSGDATASNAGVLTIAANAIGTSEITDGTVSLADLNTDSVNSAKVVDGSITGTDLATNTVAGTNIALGGDAVGDMMYYNGTDWVLLTATGNANRVLQMNGTATAPAWVVGVTGNIYTLDGTLTANRTITSGGFSLTYDGAGDVVIADSGNISTTGDVAVNGGDLTSSAATLVVNAGGNVDVQDTLNADAITIDTTLAVTGNSTMTGDLALNGGDLTSTSDITVTSTGGDVFFADTTTLNIGGNATDVAFNAIGDSTAGATSLNSDDDLYIEGNLEVDGSTQFDGTVAFNSAATFSAGLSCTDCLDFSSLADALALDANTTLATGANTLTLTGIADMTGTVLSGASPLVFEGASLDANETTFAFTDPTSDQTITFPDSSGTVALWGSMSGDATASNAGVLTLAANSVASAEITDGSVSLADLNTDSVNSAKIVDASVALADLAGDSVNSAKVVDGSITGTDLAANTVTGTNIALGGDTAGDTMYYDGTDWVRLAIGTAGQFLATNGGATAPTWITGVTSNLYTADGTLTANRTITSGGFSLTYDGTGDIAFSDAGNISSVGLTTSADVAVNGGDLTTTSGTASLFNTNATTVNLAGAATALNVGAAGGLTVTSGGALTVNSAATSALSLDSGTTGSLSLGTGANAKSITIGNTTGATALTINSGADTTGGGVIINVPDNASDIFRIRQGANNYLDLTTTDGSELLAFGNAATDPSFSFLGSGTSTFSGALNVNDYSVFVSGLSAGSSQIKNVATPTDTMDAVNKAYVDAAFSSSVLWSEPVNDFYSAAAPGAPSTGDRYIILAGQSGFGCSDNNIVEYNGATWDCTLQATGTTAFVDNVTNQQFNWNGSSWVSLGSGTDHNALSNLQGGAANEYYHLELADYTPLTAVTAQLTALQTTGTPTFAGVTLTGQFSTSAGTVGAPGYAFSGDANTGLYNPAADTIGFSTGGALQMTLDSSGNLGIGDATPASPLTVGAGDAFQVSAAGAIIAATGITSSGILTLSSATVAGASPLVFEGTSVDGFETTFAITDPTAANTITFPDSSGTVALWGNMSGDATASNAGVLTLAANSVASAEITDGSVSLADLNTDSVNSSKIVDGSVTGTDLAANTVTGTNIALGGDTAGDTMYYDGTDWVRLAIGTAGQFLQVNGGATAPEWVTGATTNLYNANGTLSANRTITSGGFSLTYDGTGDISFSDAGTVSAVAVTTSANITAGGDVAVNGGDITSSAATLVVNAGGNVDIQDTLNADAITIDTTLAVTGNSTMTGDLALNGGDLTTTGDLTITPAGGDIIFSDATTFNVGGNATDVAFNAIGDSTAGATSLNSDDDLYIEGNLEVDGTTQFDGTATFNSAATFVAGLSCTDCLDFTSLADALALDAATSLATAANILTITSTTGGVDLTGTALQGTSALVFEGSSVDANETTFSITNPTGDNTITFPDSTGTVALWGAMSGDATASNAGVLTIAANAIGTSEITDGTVALADLAGDSVNSSKIVDGSIVAADVATNTIDGSHIAIGTTAGDTLYYDGTDWVRLGIGTAGQYLTTNGGATAPTWTTGISGNLYTANGTLTANRTITTGGFSLTIDGTGDIVFADSGDITTAGSLSAVNTTLSGDIAVNGGDLTSSAATLVVNAGGNVDVQDTLNADAITIDTTLAVTGNSTMTGDLALNGGDLTTTGDLTITPAGGDIIFSDATTFNVGGNATDVAFNAIGDSTAGATSLNSDDDLYIEGNLEVDGSTQFDGTVAFNSAATFAAGLSCTDCLDFTSLADALALDAATSLATAANILTITSTTGGVDLTGTALQGTSALVFEGSSVDANETTFSITNPTGDNTITFPDSTGTVALWGAMSGDATASNAGVLTIAANAIGTSEITDGTVALADLAGDSVNSSKIVDASVALADMAADSVNSANIVDLSIATADIANNAIDGSKLGIGTTAGDTLYYDGTDWVRLGIGTNGQFLATNAGATAPEWISGVTTNLYTANGTLTGNRTITTGGNSLTVDGTGNIVLADSGDISTDGDVAVNGADITTSAATFNLLNANASVINFGGDATALNLGDAAGLTMTSAGALTINSAATTDLNIDSGTTGNIDFGTGTNDKTITIGNTTGATAVNINTGTGGSTYTTTNGTFSLDTGTGAINIGTDAAAKTLTIGNSTGATAVTIDSGTGNIDIGATAVARSINIGTGAGVVQTIAVGGTGANVITIGNTQTAGSISMGAAMTTGTITLGGNAQTGTIGIGNGAFLQTITIGSNGFAAGSKTINIGDGSFANTVSIGGNGGAHNISIGNTAGGATINIGSGITNPKTINIGTGAAVANTITLGGTGANVIRIGFTQTTGSINIGNAMIGGTISIGGTGAQTGAISLGTGTGAQTINLGSGTGLKTMNIGSGTGANVVTIGSTNAAASLTLRSGAAGAVTITNLNSCAGIQTSAGGVMSCTSDATLKDIHGEFVSGLDSIMGIIPQTYSWKEDSYLFDGGALYSGFIAQNVQGTLPEAVNTGAAGYLQVSQVTILAAAVNAIKETAILIGDISEIDGVDTLVEDIQEEVANDPIAIISEKIDSGTRLLTDLVTARITAIRGYFDEVFVNRSHHKELCIGDVEDGGETCIKKADLDNLLSNTFSGGNSGEVSGGNNSNNNNNGNNNGGGSNGNGNGNDERNEEPAPEDEDVDGGDIDEEEVPDVADSREDVSNGGNDVSREEVGDNSEATEEDADTEESGSDQDEPADDSQDESDESEDSAEDAGGGEDEPQDQSDEGGDSQEDAGGVE